MKGIILSAITVLLSFLLLLWLCNINTPSNSKYFLNSRCFSNETGNYEVIEITIDEGFPGDRL